MVRCIAFDFYGVIFDKDNRVIRVDVLSVIRDLFDRGIPLYIFSNTRRESLEVLNGTFDFFKYFKRVILPNDVGTFKPSDESFEYLFSCLEEVASDILLIDDDEVNISSAKRHGMQTVLFVDGDDLRSKLLDLKLL